MKKFVACLTILAGLTAAGVGQAATMADELVGTWAFTEAATHEANGTTSYPYGKSPKGINFYEGRSLRASSVRGDIPKFTLNNRTTGTPEEYKAVVQKSIAFFGTYSIDEAKKLITYEVGSSTFPNWDGESQTLTIVELNAKEFIYKKPGASGGGDAESKLRRVGK